MIRNLVERVWKQDLWEGWASCFKSVRSLSQANIIFTICKSQPKYSRDHCYWGSWKTFASGSNSQKSAALLSKIVQKKINYNTIGHIKLANGHVTTDTKTTLEALVDEHFHGNTTEEMTSPNSPSLPFNILHG